MRNTLLLTTLALASAIQMMEASGQANAIVGRVTDKSGDGMPGATVILYSLPDSTQKSGVTCDAEGHFALLHVAPASYFLRYSFIGFLPLTENVTMANAPIQLASVTLLEDVKLIEEAVVEEIQTRVVQKGDTTVYNADAFKTNPDATVEDLIKKMPGIADEQGTLKAQGEEVTKVLVDGKEFFGSDTKAAVKNLPANMVKSIEVFDQLSDQSRFTGVNDGNTTKTINIVTKGGLEKGQFGKLYAGYGTDNRFTTGGNINYFKNKRRVSFIGMLNNINQQNFSNDDLTGMSGVQMQGMGGGSRGGGFRFGGGDTPFMTSNSGGINTTGSLGINFNDEWGKKLKLASSYFYNQKQTENEVLTNRDFFGPSNAGQVYSEEKTDNSANQNHRYNGRLEWTLDTLTSIIFTPNITYNQVQDKSLNNAQTNGSGDSLINTSFTDRGSESSRWNLSSGLQLQRKLLKPRRSISADFNWSTSTRTGETDLISENYFFNIEDTTETLYDQLTLPSSLSHTGRVDFSYTEPIGEKSILRFSYRPSFALDDSESFTYDRVNGEPEASPDSIFSNSYKNLTVSHEPGLRYSFNDEKWNITAGGSVVWSQLEGQQSFPEAVSVDRPFFNLLPEARVRYNMTKSKSWMISYRTNAQLPSVTQLQNLVNNSNPLLLTTGNPDLKQSFNHRIFSRYSGTSDDKTKTVFVMISGGYTFDYIGSSQFNAPADTVIDGISLNRGARLTRQVNLDDNWNTRFYASYGLPLLKLKCNLNLNSAVNLSQVPGIINNELNNSRNLNATAGASLASNISEKIDFSLGCNFSGTRLNNSQQPDERTAYLQYDLSARAVWMVTKHWALSSDATNSTYDGLGSGLDQSFLLLNAGLGYRIAKKNSAELKLSVFDILGRNTAINRLASDTYLEESQTQVLTRFFMLSFTYNLRKLSSPDANAPEWQQGQDRRPWGH